MENSTEKTIKTIQETLEKTTDQESREVVLRQLKEFSKEIEEATHLTTEIYKWLEPSGAENRTWEEEMRYALENRDNGYIPQMTYPILERGFLESDRKEETSLDLLGSREKLQSLKGEIKERYPEISQLAEETVEKEALKLQLLEAIKDGKTSEANDLVEKIYGGVSGDLKAFADKIYEERSRPDSELSSSAKKLKENKLQSQEMKEYFEYALSLLGAKDWRVKISFQQKAVDVVAPEKTIFIPNSREVDSIKLLKLVAHEIGVHVATAQEAIENGLGVIPFGSNYEVLQEGIAKIAEDDVEMMLLDETEAPLPYYVLGIAKAIETNGNFWEVWDYLIGLRKQEYLKRGKSEEYADKNSVKMTIPMVRRIFRGNPDLPNGGYVLTKDKSYLEGELIASEIKEAGYLGLLLAGKYDLPTFLFLLKTGVVPKEAINLTIDVAQEIWENEGDRDFLENIDWYRENYNPPYWREFGMSDEEYLDAWEKS